MTFFHGGNRGLRVGDFILPPCETGRLSTSDLVPNRVHRRNRIYVTPNKMAACLHACAHAQPTIYEVVPEELEPDLDCSDPGLSFASPRAKIVAIHKVPGKIIKKTRKTILQRRAR
jgi:hypothetical protein